MNINKEDKAEKVVEAIEKEVAEPIASKMEGVSLLSIAKKVSRNRKKGGSPE